jgi:RNA polymerase sigma-70 factor (ECF subfamily)
MAPFLTLEDRRRSAAAELVLMRERREQLGDFQRFYFEHVDFVRRVLARLLGPGHDLSDAVQEVFVVALRKRHVYAGRALPSTWLHAIAQRIALATRRRTRLRAFLGLEAAQHVAAGTTPQQHFESREASEQLYALLDRLSEKKRTVWILHELEELSGEQIAEIVRCPVKTVWTRLFHARRELYALARQREGRSGP